MCTSHAVLRRHSVLHIAMSSLSLCTSNLVLASITGGTRLRCAAISLRFAVSGSLNLRSHPCSRVPVSSSSARRVRSWLNSLFLHACHFHCLTPPERQVDSIAHAGQFEFNILLNGVVIRRQLTPGDTILVPQNALHFFYNNMCTQVAMRLPWTASCKETSP